ncbi:MAG: Ferredoxin [Pelotomaculum sp. PtaU1.Bin035]|nr:MAG: Ferredoxin [Pelotomaculum sp. PtaU1.Bin035]
MAYKITDECLTCGTCIDSCPNEAIIEDGDAYKIDLDKCENCGVCIDSCPAGAIIEE